MLSQLFINNVAVIEKASIDFDSGFTVLTGETGAGKSMIIDAISAILGERTSKELIRTGTSQASVSALFTDVSDDVVCYLSENGIEPDDEGSLLISREIKLEGKSLCKINGFPATVSMLRELGTRLISIHGQHESYELLSVDVHMKYIDSFAVLEKELSEYREVYERLRSIIKKLNELGEDEGEKARREDLLKFQISEIEEAAVTVGEQDELTARRNMMRNSEKIAELLQRARFLLDGDEENNGALDNISETVSELEKVGEYLPELEATVQKFRESLYTLEDAAQQLGAVSVDYNPAELDGIEERLELLYRLGLKYGKDEAAILNFLEKAKEELHSIEYSEEEKAKLDAEYDKEKEKAISLAREISHKRQEASLTFAKRVKEELLFLNMPGIEFVVECERVPLNINGCDKLQFLVSANKGEPAKPMAKIASGGELSRIMLAIKTVLAGKDNISTLIFDEVDTGISGEAANKVGLKLRQVSENRQVISITHLAQIAALADNHLLISKHVENERTYTDVFPLDIEERKKELARMMGGNTLSQARLKTAEEMLGAR